MRLKDNKYIIFALAGFAFTFLCFYVFLFKVFAARNEAAQKDLYSLTGELSVFYGGMSETPGQESMDGYYTRIRDLKDKKKTNVDQLKAKLNMQLGEEFTLNGIKEAPGAYFKKILDHKRDDFLEILRESSKRNIDREIPLDLGFSDDIPPDPQVEDLLKFLFIKDHLLNIALDAGVNTVSSIEHFDIQVTGPDKDTRFIREYPVKIKMTASLDTTLKILYRLRSDNQFLILRNMEIVSDNLDRETRQTDLGVIIDVAGMTFEDIREGAIRLTQR